MLEIDNPAAPRQQSADAGEFSAVHKGLHGGLDPGEALRTESEGFGRSGVLECGQSTSIVSRAPVTVPIHGEGLETIHGRSRFQPSGTDNPGKSLVFVPSPAGNKGEMPGAEDNPRPAANKKSRAPGGARLSIRSVENEV
jgi:hypothetical protein